LEALFVETSHHRVEPRIVAARTDDLTALHLARLEMRGAAQSARLRAPAAVGHSNIDTEVRVGDPAIAVGDT
jgi:hypothetical protein